MLPLTVILLGLSARSGRLAAGFRTAVLISAGLCAGAGVLAAATITNPPRVPLLTGAAPEECFHCGLDAPTLITSVSQTAGPQQF